MLLSDNFDYQSIAGDLVPGVLSEQELGSTLFIFELARVGEQSSLQLSLCGRRSRGGYSWHLCCSMCTTSLASQVVDGFKKLFVACIALLILTLDVCISIGGMPLLANNCDAFSMCLIQHANIQKSVVKSGACYCSCSALVFVSTASNDPVCVGLQCLQGYVQRVTNVAAYSCIVEDVLSRWSYPWVPDNGGGQQDVCRFNRGTYV